jgi:hypothetical protein
MAIAAHDDEFAGAGGEPRPDTIHDALARRVSDVLWRALAPGDRAAALAHARHAPNPRRLVYCHAVAIAWIVLSVAAVVVMAPPLLAANAAFPAAVPALKAIGFGASMFCVTGGAAAAWWEVRARMAARPMRRHGEGSRDFFVALARATPTQRTLPLQALVAFVAAGIAW